MEEDEVGFDAQVAEIGDAFFHVLKEFGIESGEIPLVAGFFEGVELADGGKGGGKNAHTDFIERGCFEGLEGEFFFGVEFVRPAVAGGAELEVGRTVGVGEVEGVFDGDRAVIAGGGWGAGEGAGFGGEFGNIAFGDILPGAEVGGALKRIL